MSDTAYSLGFERGYQVAHAVPSDKDLSWLAHMTDGRIQTDPQDLASFAHGMANGNAAWERENDRNY